MEMPEVREAVERVREIFEEITGLGPKTRMDAEAVEHWRLHHNFKDEDFRRVIDFEWHDQKRREYYQQNPAHFSIGTMFSPRRGDVLLSIHRSAVVKERLAQRVPEREVSYDRLAQTHRLKLACCGAVFERQMERDENGKWFFANRDDFEAHLAFCQAVGLGVNVGV